MNHPLLVSKRIQLLPFRQEDLSVFHQLNTDPFIRKYLWDDVIIPLSDSKNILIQNDSYFAEDGYGLWKIQPIDTAFTIGYAGLWYFFNEEQPQLLYALKEVYTGRGLALEAARLVVDYTFSVLNFNYLTAAMDPPNGPSQILAERLGMQRYGKKNIDGQETYFFRIEKADWIQQNL